MEHNSVEEMNEQLRMDEPKKEFYKVPIENMTTLESKIQKLNNKSVKLNLPEIKLLTVGESEVVYKDKTVTKYLHIKVEGESPKLNGYRFIATIDHLSEDGNIVRAVPDAIVPEKYRTVKPYCEHCKTQRVRRDTYLVQHENGEIFQIGKSCMRDFLGHVNPENYARYAEWLIDASEMAEASAEYNGGMGSRKFIVTETFLEYSAEFVIRYGFFSKSQYNKMYEQYGYCKHETTSSRALDAMFPDMHTYDRGNLITESDISPEAKKLTQDASEWLAQETEGKENLSDYMHNLKTVCLSYVLEYRHAGIGASLFGAYNNALNKKEEEAKKAEENSHRLQLPESEYVANIGDKIEVTVMVDKIIVNEGFYGTSYIHLMMDETNGSKFTWFCTSGTAQLEEGQSFKIKGTVKAHEEYKGTKQTILTRCKEVVEKPKKEKTKKGKAE